MKLFFKNPHIFINGFAVGYLFSQTNFDWVDFVMYFIAAITFIFKEDFNKI